MFLASAEAVQLEDAHAVGVDWRVEVLAQDVLAAAAAQHGLARPNQRAAAFAAQHAVADVVQHAPLVPHSGVAEALARLQRRQRRRHDAVAGG
jgi:hypothetical protein